MHQLKVFRAGRNFCLMLTLLSLSTAMAQKQPTAESIVKKVSDKYIEAKYFSYMADYTMYEDYTSKKVIQTYSGNMLKNNGVFYSKIKSTEIVGFKGYSVKVNHEERAIMISKTDQEQIPFDIKSYLSGFKSTLKSDKTYWICEFVPAGLTQVMLSKVVVYIKKSDYSIAMQKLYYVNSIESKGKKSIPRMEITYLVAKKTENDNLVTTERNYFTRVGNDIKVAKRFKDYKLYKV